MKMKEIEEAASYIQEQAHEDANIIFGAAVDENMGDMMKVTVIATGFDQVAGVDTQASTAVAVRTNLGAPAAASPPIQHAPPISRTYGTAHPATMRPSLGASAAASLGELRGDEPSVPSTRRPPARELSVGATSHREPRDRTSFVPPTDSDWDTPAFQRRGH